MLLSRLRERTGFNAEATESYETLAGFVMSTLDSLPVKGDAIEHDNWRLTVTNVQERRVTQVHMTRL